MSYLVLARKYRPRTFAEVCEQGVAVHTLRGAIAEGRIGHAYLLHGPRGTGKTTTARILAKSLNCERGPTPDPCGQCERCLAVDRGGEADIIEIDAASNRGIDDVRDLRKEVVFAPMKARFKVYIVDEVHQMTGPAFDALLKTLEEPPAHVKFIFATTELDRVPETIRSRCQLLALSLLSEPAIAARLAHVLATENVPVEAGVVEALAKLARGSLRDALSATDQVIALSGGAPTLDDVKQLAGAGGPERVEAVLAALEQRDKRAVLAALERTEGSERVLIDALLEHLRGGLLSLHCGDRAQLFGAEPAERERRAQRAARLGSEKVEAWMLELLAARERIERGGAGAHVVLELTLLDLCRLEPSISLAELEDRLRALEDRLAPAGALARTTAAPERPPASAPRPDAAARAEPAPRAESATRTPSAAQIVAPPPAPRVVTLEPQPRATPPQASASAATIAKPAPAPAPTAPSRGAATRGSSPRSSVAGTWSALLAELAASAPDLAAVLTRCGKLVDVSGACARIQLTRAREPDGELATSDASRQRIEDVLARLLARPVRAIVEDTSKRPPGDQDAFTRTVADLFQGHIEES